MRLFYNSNLFVCANSRVILLKSKTVNMKILTKDGKKRSFDVLCAYLREKNETDFFPSFYSVWYLTCHALRSVHCILLQYADAWQPFLSYFYNSKYSNR